MFLKSLFLSISRALFANNNSRKSSPSKKMFKSSAIDYNQKHEFMQRFKIIVDRVLSNRKITACLLILLLIFIYFGPSWFLRRKASLKDESVVCLNDYISRTFTSHPENSFDIFVRSISGVHQWSDNNRNYAPFVGNGYFGQSLNERYQTLWIRHGRTIDLQTSFEPLVKIIPKFAYTFESEATVLDIRKGSVTKITSHNVAGECAFISSTIYAHRTRQNLFVQEILIQNPTTSSLMVGFERARVADNGKFKILKNSGTWTSAISRIKLPGHKDSHYDLIVGQEQVLAELIVKPRRAESLRILTAIIVSDLKNSSVPESGDSEAANKISKIYKESMKVDSRLYAEHTAAWSELWNRGFSISYSKAPNTLNGDLVNATVYYLLSTTPSYLNSVDDNISESLKQEKRKMLYNSEECFNSHNRLMYPSRLWSHLSTVKDVFDVSYRWKLTLDKRGCTSLISAGAEGVMQAMMLSFGGLKNTNHHLEFDVEPRELHRNYYFRGIIYNEQSSVNIWVEVGNDNKAVLFISVNNTAPDAKKLYACDAGCLDAPVELSSERISLPVKLTDPLTPILYITDDQKHIQELKHSIHVKEVAEAPPHEHHVIAMHKHGHRLGGLPTLFWAALIFLLVTFHLFLFKLIYNEYCRDDKPNYAPINRMRYAV